MRRGETEISLRFLFSVCVCKCIVFVLAGPFFVVAKTKSHLQGIQRAAEAVAFGLSCLLPFFYMSGQFLCA